MEVLMRTILAACCAIALLTPVHAQNNMPLPWKPSPIPADAMIVYQWEYSCDLIDVKELCEVFIGGRKIASDSGGPYAKDNLLASFVMALALVGEEKIPTYYYQADFTNRGNGRKYQVFGFTHATEGFDFEARNLVLKYAGVPA